MSDNPMKDLEIFDQGKLVTPDTGVAAIEIAIPPSSPPTPPAMAIYEDTNTGKLIIRLNEPRPELNIEVQTGGLVIPVTMFVSTARF